MAGGGGALIYFALSTVINRTLFVYWPTYIEHVDVCAKFSDEVVRFNGNDSMCSWEKMTFEKTYKTFLGGITYENETSLILTYKIRYLFDNDTYYISNWNSLIWNFELYNMKWDYRMNTINNLSNNAAIMLEGSAIMWMLILTIVFVHKIYYRKKGSGTIIQGGHEYNEKTYKNCFCSTCTNQIDI